MSDQLFGISESEVPATAGFTAPPTDSQGVEFILVLLGRLCLLWHK